MGKLSTKRFEILWAGIEATNIGVKGAVVAFGIAVRDVNVCQQNQCLSKDYNPVSGKILSEII
jgi:hypothetical protein